MQKKQQKNNNQKITNMEIKAAEVMKLRHATNAGMMDCKKALQEAEGNMERAIDILREKGLSKVAKKSDRIAAEGLVSIEINADNTVGAIVEINSETDFVAKNEDFKTFVKDVAEIALATEKDSDIILYCANIV